MKYKVGDVFFYRFWATYWIVGRVTNITDTDHSIEIYFVLLKESREDSGGYPLDRFQVGSQMYRDAKIIKDDSNESLLAVML